MCVHRWGQGCLNTHVQGDKGIVCFIHGINEGIVPQRQPSRTEGPVNGASVEVNGDLKPGTALMHTREWVAKLYSPHALAGFLFPGDRCRRSQTRGGRAKKKFPHRPPHSHQTRNCVHQHTPSRISPRTW